MVSRVQRTMRRENDGTVATRHNTDELHEHRGGEKQSGTASSPSGTVGLSRVSLAVLLNVNNFTQRNTRQGHSVTTTDQDKNRTVV